MTSRQHTAVRIPKLPMKSYLGYAAGDAANNFAFSTAGMFLLLYYTNVVGISGAAVGTMFLILRFIDAFSDVTMGGILDVKKPGKMGKFRPIIMWFCIPLVVTNWLMYTAKLFFPDQGSTFYTVYMYVTYALMGSIFYTIVNISYGSMAPSMTQVPAQRAKLATFRTMGANAAILILSWAISPVIQAYRDDPIGLQNKLALVMGILGIVAAAMYLFTVFTTAERVVRPSTPVSLKDSLHNLAINRPLQILAISTLFILVAQTSLSTLGSYIGTYVQGNANWIAINNTAQVASIFIISPFIPRLIASIGKRKGFMLMSSFAYLGALIIWLFPISSVPWLGALAFLFLGFAVNGVNTLMWALEADTVEYGEWKTGMRTEGTTYAIFSFARKMGQALGGFFGGWALTWAAYNGAEAARTGAIPVTVAHGIVMWFAILLIVFTLIGQLIMWFYPLSEDHFTTMVDEITSRREAISPTSSSTAPATS